MYKNIIKSGVVIDFDLYKLIIDFKGKYDKEFHKYLKEKLGDEFNMEEDVEDVIYKLFMNA